MVEIKKLDNGVQVVLEEIDYVRSISFGIWVRNGSRNEVPEFNGMSHFIEHMLFKGTENRTAKQIAEEIDKICIIAKWDIAIAKYNGGWKND